MAFNRPSIKEIISRIEADVDSRLVGSDPKLRSSIMNAVVNGVAALTHGLYGNLDWLAKQIIPDTADAEILDRHADWRKIPRNAAKEATGIVDFAGNDGSVIVVDTILQRSDAVEFTTDSEVTIAAGVASVAVTASVPGQDGNTVAGSILTISTPIPGVDSSPTVNVDGLSGGTDIEDIEDWRARVRERDQSRPQGGAKIDYENWAKDIAGVTRVWVFPQWLGAGTIGVFFTRDDDASIIPDAGEVTTVQDYIDSLRPVTADVTVFAPTDVPQAMTIQIAPNTSAVQTTIESALDDLFRLEAQVEDGAGSGTILISHIREAISLAIGETDHVMVSPVADITLSAGELASLGAITWQSIP